MDKEIKREARKQFFKYFRVWFIVLGVLAVAFFVKMGIEAIGNLKPRGNNQAPEERVYDHADVLTDEEEQKLRERIADCEQTYHIDLVLVTINEDVESQGYWDTVMMNKADDFYDHNNYGYNKVHGDGALLLDNWYEDENGSQKGSWLSTCGLVMNRMGDYEIDRVLDEVYFRVESNPYSAYKAYIDEVCDIVEEGSANLRIPFGLIILAPAIIAVAYALINLKQSPAKDTVAANAYVAGGEPVILERNDDFIRKNVVTRRIESSSSGGGGGRSGGGGRHRSSSGVSHGGGGRRR